MKSGLVLVLVGGQKFTSYSHRTGPKMRCAVHGWKSRGKGAGWQGQRRRSVVFFLDKSPGEATTVHALTQYRLFLRNTMHG